MKKNRRILKKYDGLKYGWLKDAEKFLLLLLIVFLVFRFVVGCSLVKGYSMETTLHNGEAVMYLRICPQYQNGDVVSVKIPSGQHYVKRIIATEGDTIDVRDGVVYVNENCVNEPYVTGTTKRQDDSVVYPLTLGEGQVFIMGDNREKSIDSRTFGVIGERQIYGKIWFCVGKYGIHLVK